MVERGVNRLPVVKDEMLLGIVTRADLVHACVRPDEQIATEISEDVLRRDRLDRAGAHRGRGATGRVKLAGTLGRRSQAELLLSFVSKVPGVVTVDERDLSLRIDDLARRRGDEQITGQLAGLDPGGRW